MAELGEASGVMQLPSDVSIGTIEEVYLMAKNALDHSLSLQFDLSQIEQADVTLIQLLLAIRTSAALSGKSVALHPAPGPAAIALFERAGLLSPTVDVGLRGWLQGDEA